jgi:hypothetical protein
VFNSESKFYSEFSPVNQWLHNKEKAKLVYGGTKYREEMSELRKYLPYLVELRRLNRIAEIDDRVVDSEEAELYAKVLKADFNDAHIIAIFISSGCQVLCSKDKHADRYLKMNSLYPEGKRPPKIYRGKKHIHLLCDKNLVNLQNRIR